MLHEINLPLQHNLQFISFEPKFHFIDASFIHRFIGLPLPLPFDFLQITCIINFKVTDLAFNETIIIRIEGCFNDAVSSKKHLQIIKTKWPAEINIGDIDSFNGMMKHLT